MNLKSLFFSFIILIFTVANFFAQTVVHAEILGRPTNQSITISILFNEKTEVCVQFGKTESNLTEQTPWNFTDEEGNSDILIDNLTSNTKYYYRVCYRKSPNDPIHTRSVYSFHTQRNKGENFSFVVQADPHLDEMSDTALYRRCLNNQLTDKADFMIDLGDIIMTDKLKDAGSKISRDTIRKRCEFMRAYYASACHSLPLFIALGNHEGEAGWQLNGNGENIAVWNTMERKKYFPNPYPNNFYTGDEMMHDFVGLRENYYSWSWGDALFIVLDPYWYTNVKPGANTGWNWTLGKKQYDWLKNTLEHSTEKYKFIFAHQLIGGDPMGRGGIEFAQWYEWGGYNLDGSYGFTKQRPGWYKPIKDLLIENKVSIFFHGHDHFFGKQEQDCLIYQECPQPSLPNFNTPNQAADYGYVNGLILPNAGHLRISVSPDEAKVEYVRAYLAQNETATRKNKDISATYYIRNTDCYDTLSTGVSPVIWNQNYEGEIIFPNPYSNHALLKFSLKEANVITIQLYNEKGQWIRNILNQNLLQAGDFEISLNDNNNSNVLKKGTYYYSIYGSHGILSSGKLTKL